MRHQLIQIPLLLHETDLAKQQCQTWLASTTGDEGLDSDLRWERESIEFLAGEGQPFDIESPDPIENFFARYQHALLAYSNDQYEDAIGLLAACPFVAHAGFLKWWARAFEQHFRKVLAEKTPCQRISHVAPEENDGD